MGVQVTVRDDSIPAGMKRYAEEKADRLTKFFDGVQSIEVVLDTEGQNKWAEIVMSVSKGDRIAVHAEHEQMNAAIDLVLDRAERSLKKHKEKLRDYSRPEPAAPSSGNPESDEELESYQEIVDKTEFPD
ncbi:MAG: ribosome-associated translation inhibitor RaiA [Planctomycetes bacterium]|nr:ribosome-associated translation inhibitor RaiA [Planctomycetota bacterium]